MRAFIVRPFAARSGIDFDRVQADLVDRALAATGIAGDTTQQFVEAGNIRVDMFEQLLLADLVIADISIHNANVFYELGIRHALRERQTILIRAKVSKPRADRSAEDDVPFDLRTDRYLEYDHTNPGASLPDLTEAIRATRDGTRTDSPVFLSLPGLVEQDRARFAPLPRDFAEEVGEAEAAKDIPHLALLASEAVGFSWAQEGCRLVSDALFNLRAWEPARRSLESLRSADQNDTHANLRLATVYQRLGNLTKSDQAIDRVLAKTDASRRDRSESLALRGSNEKTRWVDAWRGAAVASVAADALRSPFLATAIDGYRAAFMLDLRSFYPGLVALSLLTIQKELSDRLPDVWSERFDNDDEAAPARRELETQLATLAGAVRLALDAAPDDQWAPISRADYQFLVARRASVALDAYRAALGKQRFFHSDAARRQLQIFADLGLKTDRVTACLAMFAEPPAVGPAALPSHVVLFTGHRLDASGRRPARFPRECVKAATDEIREYVRELQPTLGIAALASGGDMVFHAVCTELGVPSVVRLVMPPGPFVNASVADAGGDIVDAFWGQLNAKQAEGRVATLSEGEELPVWLRRKPDYSVWQRANLWMLEEALSLNPHRLTVLALWNGKEGDGPGGTKDLIERAKAAGATPMIIDTNDVCRPTAPDV